MKRILLLQSFNAINNPPVFPLGLSYLVKSLSGYDLRGLDLNLSENPYDDLRRTLQGYSPDVLAFSIRNIKIADPGRHVSCLEDHIRTVEMIKRICPETCLVAGGSAFSMYGKQMMERLPPIDFGVFGEGETVFPRLLRDPSGASRMKGVYWRENSAVRFAGMPERLDFSHIPAPDRDLFSPRRYLGDPAAVGVQTKRGCRLNCLYCSDLYLLGHAVSCRKPSDVVAEIEALKVKYGVEEFFFADQLFNLPRDYSEEIVERLAEKRLGMKWLAWFNEKGLTNHFVRRCKEAGLMMLNFSPDAVNDQRLSYLGKNATVADMKKAVRIAGEERMPLTYNFLVNGPGETLRSLLQTIGWILSVKFKLGGLCRLHGSIFHLMRIYPETPLQAIALEKGLIDQKTDLMEPVFYNPYPLRVLTSAFLKVLGWGSKFSHWIKGRRKGRRSAHITGAVH